MCGIFGALGLGPKAANVSADVVTKGVKLLHHRGPDGYGVDGGAGACIGHTRLSIIDLAAGHQPMWSHDKRGAITYNGEIYNFEEIKARLERLGHVFDTRSDTEVALAAYLEWGAGCLEHFRGMFAFAAVDFKKRKALVARDRLGKKPLFYTIKDSTLFFSSELEPLYQTVGPFRMDMRGLDDYLSWQYIHAPGTIYKDVMSLPPAHLVEIDLESGKTDVRRYWRVRFSEDRSLSIEDWLKRLDGLVRESVKIRLVSDVPFGAFLSGGIDSSIVVGYMAEIMEQPVKTFNIGFKEADFSEMKYAEMVAKANRTEHHTEIVEANSLSLLPTLARRYGEPFADSSAIPTYYVCRMARRHVKMVLSGDGGDENFAGYNSYEYIMRQMSGNLNSPQSPPAQRLINLGQSLIRKFTGLLDTKEMVDKAYGLHCQTAHHFAPSEREKLFKNEYRGLVEHINPNRRALMDIGDAPLISRLQHLDLMAYLPFDILTKVDIAAMANSLEVRVPLLDHVLVETAATIPAEFKLREEEINRTVNYDKKYILKLLAKKRYPAEIIDRPKMGFGVPLGKWFANELNAEVRRRLLGSDCLPEVFDMGEVSRLVESHAEKHDLSARLWNLLFLEEWMRGHSYAVQNR